MREDIDLEEYAKSLGWSIDKSNPNYPATYYKPDKTIWFCGQSYPKIRFWWQARNKNKKGLYEPYNKRREYNSLKEALDNE